MVSTSLQEKHEREWRRSGPGIGNYWDSASSIKFGSVIKNPFKTRGYIGEEDRVFPAPDRLMDIPGYGTELSPHHTPQYHKHTVKF
jgi:hypothetical protein